MNFITTAHRTDKERKIREFSQSVVGKKKVGFPWFAMHFGMVQTMIFSLPEI